MAQLPKKKKPLPEHSARDESELIALAQEGTRSAYLELFLRHLPALERYVKREIRYLENAGSIEPDLLDHRAVIDQVYIAALENLKRMPPTASFRGWLRYLATHILEKNARLELAEESAGLALEGLAPSDDNIDSELWEYYQPDDVVRLEDTVQDSSAQTPEEWLQWREAADELQDKLNTLPAEVREAFVLRVIEGLSVDEIAEMKKKPPTVIRQAIHDAREALRASGVLTEPRST